MEWLARETEWSIKRRFFDKDTRISPCTIITLPWPLHIEYRVPMATYNDEEIVDETSHRPFATLQEARAYAESEAEHSFGPFDELRVNYAGEIAPTEITENREVTNSFWPNRHTRLRRTEPTLITTAFLRDGIETRTLYNMEQQSATTRLTDRSNVRTRAHGRSSARSATGPEDAEVLQKRACRPTRLPYQETCSS